MRRRGGHASPQSVKLIRTMPEYKDGRLREFEETLRVLLGSILDYSIFLLDPDGRVVSWNAGAQRLKGYSEDEILGQSFSRFYSREDIELGKPERGLELASAEGRFEEEGWRVRKN